MVRFYVVKGRVQGVGFRWFVHRIAGERKLKGWVRNTDEGHVEIMAAGSVEITVARLLQIVTFSRPRRVRLNDRSTIAYDFSGDEHAKTKGRNEDALKKVSGTVWVDEDAREVSRMSAVLDDNFHIGYGLLASVAKGSNVVFDQALIRDEAWLPTAVTLHLQARALLVATFRADIDIRFDQYRKFQTDAVEQPGATIH